MSIKTLVKSVKDGMKALYAERDRLVAEVSGLDMEIEKLLGSDAPQVARGRSKFRGMKRFKNERTLLGTMYHVMGSDHYTLDEITGLVKSAGYRSHGDLKNMIYQKLYISGVRKSDGTYSLKKRVKRLARTGE